MKKRSFKFMLYVAATLMALCTVFILYKSNLYIGELRKQGLDITKEFIEVVNYYVSTLVPFIFYTIVLFTLGYLGGNLNDSNLKKATPKLEVEHEYKIKESDKEIDELFNEVEIES